MTIDDFTIHCVEMTIKELLIENKNYQNNVMDKKNNAVEYLIFENRVLILYELLGKVQELKTSRKEHFERLKGLQ